VTGDVSLGVGVAADRGQNRRGIVESTSCCHTYQIDPSNNHRGNSDTTAIGCRTYKIWQTKPRKVTTEKPYRNVPRIVSEVTNWPVTE
jgi:hypothetical protein